MTGEAAVGPWTVLAEATAVRDRWIDLVRQRCRTPAGAELDPFYVQRQPDWVNVLAVTEAGRLLRVRQWRQGARTLSTELPGGVVDAGETAEAAGARELLEETGFRGAAPVRLASLWANPHNQTNRTVTVLITGCRRVAGQSLDATEALEVEESEPAAVLDDVRSGRMEHALHVAAVLAAHLHRPDLFEAAAPAGEARA